MNYFEGLISSFDVFWYNSVQVKIKLGLRNEIVTCANVKSSLSLRLNRIVTDIICLNSPCQAVGAAANSEWLNSEPWNSQRETTRHIRTLRIMTFEERDSARATKPRGESTA